MATGSIVVNILDVGQGQGNFVEVYDNSSTPVLTNTLLFDLGSAKSSKTAGGGSIDYIVDKVSGMSKPRIDYLSLSHKDKDHINLIVKLLSNIITKSGTKGFSIGKIRYGGSISWYNDDLVKELKKICTDISPLNIRHTCYDVTNDQWVPVWSGNDVFVYIILANVPDSSSTVSFSSSKPDSELANCVSIISSVWWNNNQFFILGDATFTTMQESNKVYAFLPNFEFPQMVTLPHHGSRKTTFGLSSSTASAQKASTDVVNAFANKIGAKSVTASAEVFGAYHHPSYDVIELFNQYTQTSPMCYDNNLDGNDRHYLSAYLDTPFTNSVGKSLSDVYSSFETTTNTYSTLYCNPGYVGGFLAPPRNPVDPGTTFPTPKPIFPKAVQWVYTVDSSGNLTLAPKTNRLTKAMLETWREFQEVTVTSKSIEETRRFNSQVKLPAKVTRKWGRKLKLHI